MKKLMTILLVAFSMPLFSQNVGINNSGAPADNSAMLDVSANDKGVLIPRLTAAQRTGITSPATGLLVYQSDGESGFYYFDGSDWITFLDGKKGWSLDGNAGTDPLTDYLGTSDATDFSLRSNGTDRVRIQSGGPSVFNNNVSNGPTVLNTWAIGTDNAFAAEAVDGAAVLAFTETADGVFADRSSTSTGAFAGVWGQSSGERGGVFVTDLTSLNAAGVEGSYLGGVDDGIGVLGFSEPAAGWGIGGRFIGGWRGIWATTPTGTPFSGAAVYAEGDLVATGTKMFEIDHPFDPENKLLRHFAIESSEILNHYRGVDVFDENGTVTITLPDYFEAINRSFSYQLTAVGAAMPQLHIREEIEGNSFVIAGGEAGKKVSWVVEAERNDKYLQTTPEKRRVEIYKKPIYRGEYYDPHAYGVEKDDSYSKIQRHEMKARPKSNDNSQQSIEMNKAADTNQKP